MPRTAPLVLLAVLVIGAVPAAAQQPAFTIEVTRGEAPSDDSDAVALVRDEGDAWAWDVDVPDAYVVAEVRVQGFDLERPRQLLPEYDDAAQHGAEDEPHLHPHFFQDIPRDVADADARVANYTLEGCDGGLDDAGCVVVLRLGLTGPGPATLLLRVDRTPPAFTLEPPANVTHYSFMLRTTTDEFAYGDVRVRPAEGGDEVANPTAVPALEQTFPVQGLDEATTYAAYVVFRDWSGNEARSPPFTVTTAARPVAAAPEVVGLVPAPNATVAPGTEVAVTLEGMAPIERAGIRFFLDKRELAEGVTLRPETAAGHRVTVTHVPAPPLAPGFHSVAVEVVDTAGGEAVARWSFTVEGADAPAGALVGALAAMLVALARRRA